MKNNSVLVINSKLFALYFMQFTYLLPFMHFLNSMLLVIITSLVIITFLIIINGFRYMNVKLLVCYLLLIMMFMCKLLDGVTKPIVLLYIIAFTAPPVYLYNYAYDYEEFLKSVIRISKISFFIISLDPMIKGFNYMRFGYAMVPIVLSTYIDLIYGNEFLHEKKNRALIALNAIIIATGSLLILLYGARGSVLVLIIFFFLDRVFLNKKNTIRNGILFSGAVLLYMNAVPILDLLETISINIGIYSYSITKFKMQISGGFEYAGSGRAYLFTTAIEKIKQSPFIGNPILMDDEGGEYAHNLFLQVGEDFGVIAIVIVVFFILYILVVLWSKKKLYYQEKLICLMLFSISVGRLMFSSTLWRRPEFWMLVAFIITCKSNRRYNQKLISVESAYNPNIYIGRD